MNADVKAKWLAALRSGKYRQTKDRLRDDTGFCCLGVLCDLHRKETGNKWDSSYWYLDHESELPLEVLKWARLRKDCGALKRPIGNAGTLAELNDFGAKFKEIADVIEKQL